MFLSSVPRLAPSAFTAYSVLQDIVFKHIYFFSTKTSVPYTAFIIYLPVYKSGTQILKHRRIIPVIFLYIKKRKNLHSYRMLCYWYLLIRVIWDLILIKDSFYYMRIAVAVSTYNGYIPESVVFFTHHIYYSARCIFYLCICIPRFKYLSISYNVFVFTSVVPCWKQESEIRTFIKMSESTLKSFQYSLRWILSDLCYSWKCTTVCIVIIRTNCKRHSYIFCRIHKRTYNFKFLLQELIKAIYPYPCLCLVNITYRCGKTCEILVAVDILCIIYKLIIIIRNHQHKRGFLFERSIFKFIAAFLKSLGGARTP